MTEAIKMTPSRLTTLYQVSQKINSELNLEILLNEIMDQAIDLLQAEKGLILLSEPPSDGLRVKVARAMDRQNIEHAVNMSRTVIDKVEKEEKSFLLQRVLDFDGGNTTESMVEHRLKSIICVPVRAKEALLGAIYLDTREAEHFFDEEDLLFLEAFANMAGMAIENARHYRQVKELNASLEKRVEQRTGELQQANSELRDAVEELHKAQVQLIRSEKMASLGQLVAGVAHEINTPLGSLNSSLNTFTRGLEKIDHLLENPGHESFAKAAKAARSLASLSQVNQQACDRISQIVKALRNFARLDEEEFKPVDLHEGIESALTLMGPEYQERIEIERSFSALPELPCRAAQLNQVFMNILRNAIQAIEGHGKIIISTRMDEDQAVVQFSDTGSGITPEHISRIFDPGFTTRGVKVGIGLGLSIAYQIIEDHQGTIKIDSSPGSGTTVVLRLPYQTPFG